MDEIQVVTGSAQGERHHLFSDPYLYHTNYAHAGI